MKNYEWVGFLVFATLTVLPTLPFLSYIRPYFFSRTKDKGELRNKLLASAIAMVAIYAVVSVDAFLIEPNWVEVKQVQLSADISAPLRILHLSDLHIETDFPKREQWLLEQIAVLKPDLILITGDIHQMDNFDIDSCRRVLESINAPLGVYGVVGYDNVSVLKKAKPELIMLQDEAIIVERGQDKIGIAGFASGLEADKVCALTREADYRIVMNHTPDLADAVAKNDIDLYLCGHTHGGQVRIPFWGAIITNAASGKQYEAGLNQNGKMWIYTSRGLGLEPSPAPQVRFLCRPEITLITLQPVSILTVQSPP